MRYTQNKLCALRKTILCECIDVKTNKKVYFVSALSVFTEHSTPQDVIAS